MIKKQLAGYCPKHISGDGIKTMKKIILYLLVLIIGAGGFLPAAVAEDETFIIVDYTQPMNRLIPGWEFPYADEWFGRPAEEFNRELAKGSIGLTVSAFGNAEETGLDLQYETYLKGAGFEDIHPFGYDIPKGSDTFAGVIGRKRIGETTVVAVAGRGGDYGKEWAGNLNLGEEERHAGFAQAAKIVEDELTAYLAKYPADGPVRLWVTGYSRSAAVGNLAAADWIASGEFEAVYAYLFACPRTTTNPSECPGIFNILCSQDIVPQIPMQLYGFERNGKDLFLPSTETVTHFAELKKAASEIMQKMTGRDLIVNPEINVMLRLLVSFLGRIFETRGDYVRQFQQKMFASALQIDESESALSLLPGMLSGLMSVKLPDGGKKLLSSLSLLSTYLVMRAAGLGKDNDIQNGYWDPEDSSVVNMIREHLASTYISWVFSDLKDEEVFHAAEKERILFLKDCENLTVSCEGKTAWMLEKGIMKKAEEDSPGWARTGSEMIMMILPVDGEYRITAETKDGTFFAVEAIISPDITICDTVRYYTASVSKDGSYELDACFGDSLICAENRETDSFECKQIKYNTEDLVTLATLGFSENVMQSLNEAN